MLHHGVITEIVKHAIGQIIGTRELRHLFGLGCRGGQRLLAQHVLAGFERGLGHGEMERVGCADVHGLDFFVLQQGAVISGAALDADFGRELLRLLVIGCSDGHNFHVSDAADTLGVHPPHESGSQYGCFYFAHVSFPNRLM